MRGRVAAHAGGVGGLARLAFLALLAAGTPAHAQAPAPGDAPGTDHEIRLPAADRAALGEHRALSLTIAPRPGHTISREGPVLIELRAGADSGVHLPRQRYRRRDAADTHAEAPRFDLRYRAAAPGRHVLTVELRFWVCARRTCRPVRATREVTIEVAPADAPEKAPEGQAPAEKAPQAAPGPPPEAPPASGASALRVTTQP